MDRDRILASVRDALETDINRAGAARLPILSQSTEQVAIDVLDAIESAGYAIVPAGSGVS